MPGGLLQIASSGIQDIYLTKNPEITFFKKVYRRHTNFSMESISQPFTGTADFGNTATTIISRSGDLMYRTYISCKTPTIDVKKWPKKIFFGCANGLSGYPYNKTIVDPKDATRNIPNSVL